MRPISEKFQVKILISILYIVLCSAFVKAESWPVTLPPDPTNAALLYYQAFLKNAGPDEVIKFLVYEGRLEDLDQLFKTGQSPAFERLKEDVQEFERNFKAYGVDLKEGDTLETATNKIERFAETVDVNEPTYTGGHNSNSWKGDGPNPFSKKHRLIYDLSEYRQQRRFLETLKGQDLKAVVERYLNSQNSVFELVRDASNLSFCDWGCQYSKGINAVFPQTKFVRPLSYLIETKILYLLSEAKTREALAYCIVLDRMALHISDNTLLTYIQVNAVKGQFLRMLRFLLPYIESDVELLTDVRESLLTFNPNSLSLAGAFKRELQLTLQTVCNNEGLTDSIKKATEYYQQMNDAQGPVPTKEMLLENASKLLRQIYMESCDIIGNEAMSFAQKTSLSF